MKATILKTSILFLFFSFVWVGWRKENETGTTDACIEMEDHIVGKWKLTSVEVPFAEKLITIDYSGNNIIYHFHKNNRVVITADIIDFNGSNPRQYPYEISPSEFEGICAITLGHYFKYEAPTLCIITGENLTINDSALDGNIFYFTRIQ